MKKIFFLDKQVVGVPSYEEVIEFDDDVTKEEVEEIFTEWVFEHLDSAILDFKED